MKFDLRTERVNRGITIRELAETTGLSRHTIMRIEAGVEPQAPTKKAIADWLGTTPVELWPPTPMVERTA